MKNDEFSDAIRRKLDSVSPPFQEKKWVQFQHFMRQAGFPPSVWQSPHQWWQPALSAATVAGLVVVSVWQYQANKTLNQHVQTLTQSIDRLEKAQTTLKQSVMQLGQVATRRSDTVYVVQRRDHYGVPSLTYTAEPPRMTQPLAQAKTGTTLVDPVVPSPANVPGISHQSQRPESRLAQRSAPQYTPARGVNEMGAPASGTPAPNTPGTTAQPNLNNLSNNRYASPEPVPKATGNLTSPAETRLANGQQPGQETLSSITDQPTRQPNSRKLTNATPAYDTKRYVPSLSSPITTDKATNSKSDTYASTESIATMPQPIPQAVPQVIQPLNTVGITLNNEALATNWASRLRRVRYRSPYAPAAVAAAAPANRPTPSAIQWRLGIGGDIGTAQSAVSVNTEAVIGRWTIGAGVGQVAWRGDAFQNEAQFTQKTRRDFRDQYPSGIPMPPTVGRPSAAVDITRSGRALVVPLQVGYRLAVGKRVQLTPFVGANLGLNASETIYFDYERSILRPPHDNDDTHHLSVLRPLGWYSSWTVGLSAERQWKHFVGQLSPFAAVPFSANELSLNTASVGLRARLYYQF